MKNMIKEFKEFAMKGNVVDLAVGLVLGAAFGAIVKSLVDDIIMPPIGLLLGKVDFSNLFVVIREGTTPPPYNTVSLAREAGAVTLNIGVFINVIISFVIVAFAMFMIIKAMNRMKKEPPKPEAVPTTKECPFCLSTVPLKATKCPFCTSDLK